MGNAIDYEEIVNAAEQAEFEWNRENNKLETVSSLPVVHFWGMAGP